MGPVVTFFLRAKHWQIFLLLFGIGYVGGTAALLVLFVVSQSPEELLKTNLPFAVVTVLFMICLVAWLWSMGSFLNSIVRPTLRLGRGFFHFALLYPTIYIVVFLILFDTTNLANLALLGLIFPLHFLAMFCIFYDLYFVSKTLALVETGKTVSFKEYAGSLFLLWFFPIGVWIIQPKINRLYAEKGSTQGFGGTITVNS